MKFYSQIFLGFYCMVKKLMPAENNADAYAVGFITGAVCFLYFSITILFMKRSASILETIGVFFIIYAGHHLLFVSGEKYKKLEEEVGCSNKLIYRSLLYFFTALFILMYASTKLS